MDERERERELARRRMTREVKDSSHNDDPRSCSLSHVPQQGVAHRGELSFWDFLGSDTTWVIFYKVQ